MTWIQTVAETEASGELKGLYEGLAGMLGFVPNVMQASSLKLNILKALMGLVGEVMFGESGLSRAEREMIALVVSQVNSCQYCAVAHGMALRMAGVSEETVKKIGSNWREACAQPRDYQMLQFAEQVTRDATKIREEDLAALREVGFSDADILDIVHVACLFNYLNRVADALGVPLDDVLAQAAENK